MKLQKQLSRKVGDKEYSKYVVIIPPKIVKEMNLHHGDEIDVEIIQTAPQKNKMVIRKLEKTPKKDNIQKRR